MSNLEHYLILKKDVPSGLERPTECGFYTLEEIKSKVEAYNKSIKPYNDEIGTNFVYRYEKTQNCVQWPYPV